MKKNIIKGIVIGIFMITISGCGSTESSNLECPKSQNCISEQHKTNTQSKQNKIENTKINIEINYNNKEENYNCSLSENAPLDPYTDFY